MPKEDNHDKKEKIFKYKLELQIQDEETNIIIMYSNNIVRCI